MTEYKYIWFDIVKEFPKTKMFAIYSKGDNQRLGTIKWFNRWRKYCFFPYVSTVWSISCLEDINLFLKLANEKHKKESMG